MTENNNFDLIEIIRAILRRKKFVLTLTLLSGVIGAIFCFLQTKEYRSETTFIVKNPILVDRNYMFRTTGYEHKEFFGTADDADHIVTIGKSDNLVWTLINNFDLGTYYKITDTPKLFKHVQKRFKLKREETKNFIMYYQDPNPEKAQALLLEARKYISQSFKEYFYNANGEIINSLSQQLEKVNSQINTVDSTLVELRFAAGNALLPQRGTAIVNAPANPNTAALEKLHEKTVLKDKLVEDAANFQSLINEFEVIARGNISLLHVVQDAAVPLVHHFPKVFIILAVCLVAGFFFACIIVTLSTFYQRKIAEL